MDDINKPGQEPGAQPGDEGMTRRMDSGPGGTDPGTTGGAPYGAPTTGLGGQSPYSPPPQQYTPPPQQYTPPAQTPPPQYAPPPVTPQPYQYNQPQYNTTPTTYTPPPAGGMNMSGLNARSANPPVTDPIMATVIEIIGGLLGFMGIGHMLSGFLLRGIVLLVGWWFALGICVFLLSVLGVCTFGLGFCLLPLPWLAGPIISGLYLRGELIGQPLFRR